MTVVAWHRVGFALFWKFLDTRGAGFALVAGVRCSVKVRYSAFRADNLAG